MSKESNARQWIESKMFRLTKGYRLRIANEGRPIKQVVIRYEDLFFTIDLDSETGDPTGGFGWSRQGGMTPLVPIREYYTATRNEAKQKWSRERRQKHSQRMELHHAKLRAERLEDFS